MNTNNQRLGCWLTLAMSIAAVPCTVAYDGKFSDDELFSSNCVVEPNMMIEISSRVDRIIDSVAVERGDWVTAGAVVAKLDAKVERAAVEHARARAAMEAEIHSYAANLDYGERTHERISELHEKKMVSSDEVDCARTEAHVAKYRLQQAQENKRLAELELARSIEVVNRHTIRSPVDGVVAERYLNPGESVEEKPILRIAQIDPLRVEMVVAGTEYGRIAQGKQATVHIDDALGSEYPATVIIVDPVIDPASGTFRVTLELPNPERRVTSGLRCDVAFLKDAGAVAATASGNMDGPEAELTAAGTMPN